jgi:hypothetical protein
MPEDQLLKDVSRVIAEKVGVDEIIARRVIYMVFEEAAKLVEQSANYDSDLGSDPQTCGALALMLRSNKHRSR